MAPKVSIVVPIYNLEKYVPRCLDALVNQTLEDIEILCVNDGSKDSAPQIIEDYKSRYPNKVKTFHKENGGEWSARTYGLKQATGEYVGFIDSDDVPELTWAEKLYTAAKNNDADIAFSGYDRVDLDTGKTVSTEMTQHGTMNKEVDWNDDFIVYANPSLWNKLYRREIVKDLEFLPFRGCNDTLFFYLFYTVFNYHMSFNNGNSLLVMFTGHFFNHNADGLLCHLLDVNRIGSDSHITNAGMNVNIKALHRNILRNTVTLLLQ